MARVLVTEEIAEPGLALLRAAGHEVDVSLGPAGGRAAGRGRFGPMPSSSAPQPR